MAFGDNENDLEMIKVAGMGVAMENSLNKDVLKNCKKNKDYQHEAECLSIAFE